MSREVFCSRIVDNTAEIQRLQNQIEQLNRELQDIDRNIRNKEALIRDQQSGFSELQCFDLGFSYEVLNIR